MSELFEQFIHCHQDATEQALSLAKTIAGKLERAILSKGSATIAFSGGSTPKAMLQQLAIQAIDWSKVYVTLVDERCVSESSDRSNWRMLKQNFLDYIEQSGSPMPHLMPLFIENESIELRATRIDQFPVPFDVVHLGMGEDAHTASFFPDAGNIDELIDINNTKKMLTAISKSSKEQRLTWSLPLLLDTEYIVLQINGDKKKKLLNKLLMLLADQSDTANTNTMNENRKEFPVLAVLERTCLVETKGVLIGIYTT